MEHINLSLRCTNGYELGYASLDEWRDIGSAKLLAPRNIRSDYEYYTQDLTRRLIVSRDVAARYSADEIQRAINDTLSHSGCRHEHDCCGCVSYYASAIRVRGREYLVKIHSTRNV